MRKRDVADKAARTPHQRLVLQARDGSADYFFILVWCRRMPVHNLDLSDITKRRD
jgi:hypothetical protein